MIRNVSVEKSEQREKSEHRKQRRGEKCQARHDRPRTIAIAPDQDCRAYGRRHPEILHRIARIDVPLRIAEHEIHGPEQLGEIKPQRPRRHQQPVDHGHGEFRSARALLHGHRGDEQNARARRDQLDPAKIQPLAAHPQDQHHRGGQGAGGGFSEQRQREQQEADDVSAHRLVSLIDVSDPGKNRKQIEQRREHVLPLGDPGHRFHLDRMKRKDAGGQPGAAYAELLKNFPDQKRVADMQRKVHQLVAQGVEVPQRILEAKRGVNEWKILRRRAERRQPDLPQSIARAQQRICRHVVVVIPDIAAFERWQIGNRRQG